MMRMMKTIWITPCYWIPVGLGISVTGSHTLGWVQNGRERTGDNNSTDIGIVFLNRFQNGCCALDSRLEKLGFKVIGIQNKG